MGLPVHLFIALISLSVLLNLKMSVKYPHGSTRAHGRTRKHGSNRVPTR